MADKGKWFKLHIGWDDDPHIDALSLEDQARWAKFGTYMKEHGTDGTVTLVEPARSLQNKFRVNTFEEVILSLQKFPNCNVGEKQKSSVTTVTSLNVTIKNWHRYQGDFSGDRVRKFRAYVTAKKRGEEKRGEKEEKRKEKTISRSLSFSKPTSEEVEAYAKSIGFTLSGQKFCDHYEANGWRIGKNPMKNWQAAVRTWKTHDRGGANGTFLNNHRPSNAHVADNAESSKYAITKP